MKLSNEQKKMARIGIFNTLMAATILVIVKPLIKKEAISITDMLIEFIIFVLVLSAFNWLWIIGAKSPKQ
ncbi:MAG: hypothetical protein IJ456_00610 [Bacteroides sp.]|nr:hypothetical protein [Bacteroides sp.]